MVVDIDPVLFHGTSSTLNVTNLGEEIFFDWLEDSDDPTNLPNGNAFAGICVPDGVTFSESVHGALWFDEYPESGDPDDEDETWCTGRGYSGDRLDATIRVRLEEEVDPEGYTYDNYSLSCDVAERSTAGSGTYRGGAGSGGW
ncbi:hypothetical protein HON52_01645 [Candidatus Uhrbacteria bacterium]|nr:hypothetical protein [Candidatus Uhrbacteria bacterium]